LLHGGQQCAGKLKKILKVVPMQRLHQLVRCVIEHTWSFKPSKIIFFSRSTLCPWRCRFFQNYWRIKLAILEQKVWN